MFDDAMDRNDAGLFELTRRLEAYAEARLSPSAVAGVNMRASVMAAAQRRAALIVADVAREVDVVSANAPARELHRTTSRRLYRPAAALMAASLTLAVMAGTVYGANAGGPFYAARLWIEAANLPRTPMARAQAESVRLDMRIAEAQQASSDGDAPAAEAALTAYSVIVVEAVEDAAGDPAANAAIEVTITGHMVVLTQLAGTVPAHARGAVQGALTSSSNAIEQLDGKLTRGNDGQDAGPDTLGGAAQPRASGSARPSQATDPGPTAGDGVTAAPSEPPTPDKVAPARDHDAPRGGGSTSTREHAHPTAAPPAPQNKPAGTQPRGPTAP